MTHPLARAVVVLAFPLVGASATTFAQCAEEVLTTQAPTKLFGTSVGRSGSVVVVGSTRETTFGVNPGSAFIYEDRGAGFQLVETLDPSVPVDFGEYGFSVAAEDEVVVVGHPGDDQECPGVFFCRSGAVEVFERNGGTWDDRDVLRSLDITASDEFGIAVSIHGDRILVGARRDDEACPDDVFCDSGSAYLFERAGGSWVETAKLVPTGGLAGDLFGTAVALHGNRALVGASADLSLESGRAFVFEEVGGSWVQTQELVPSESVAGDAYGRTVALHGELALVGAPAAHGRGFERGVAFVFERTGGEFVEVAKLEDLEGGDGDFFGNSVSVAGGSDTGFPQALVGAPGRGVSSFGDEGAALLYERTAAGTWDLRRTILPDLSHVPFEYGAAVWLGDGRAVVGDPFGDQAHRGSVHLIDLATAGPLTSCSSTLSLTQGGTQSLELFAGAANAGETYWVLGSVSGTSPGFALGPFLVPLVFDAYTLRTVTNPLAPPLSNGLGTLDENGVATAAFTVPPGTDPALSGLVVHHAFVTVVELGVAGFASDALPATLLP